MLTKEQLIREISQICKGCRVTAGLTMQELSDKLGGVISKQSIYQFESGHNSQIYMVYCYMKAFPEFAHYWWDILPQWLEGVEDDGQTDES